MTIYEAIKHCEEKADCTACGTEHQQLAEWLKELKELREKQMPKKIEVWNGVYSCPACEILFGPKDLIDARIGAKRNCCHNCGQAIDWGGAS